MLEFNVENFFSELIFYPEHGLEQEDRKKAYQATILLGIFTVGIAHLLVGIGQGIYLAGSYLYNACVVTKKDEDLDSTEKKTFGVANKNGVNTDHKIKPKKNKNEISGFTFEDCFNSLKELEDSNNEKIEELLLKLTIPNRVTLFHAYDYHTLADQIAHISDEIFSIPDPSQQNRILAIWKRHLTVLKDMQLKFPDDYLHTFDVSQIERKLRGETPKIQVSLVDSSTISAKSLSSLVSQIVKIERECFVADELVGDDEYDKKNHKQILKKRLEVGGHQFFIAKDTTQGDKIVGVLEYQATGLIYSIGRKASYSRCGVAALLWKRLKNTHPKKEFYLQHREGNPAQKVYEKWGFRKEITLGRSFRQPSEYAIRMVRPADQI